MRAFCLFRHAREFAAPTSVCAAPRLWPAGVHIILIDFWPKAVRYQGLMFGIVGCVAKTRKKKIECERPSSIFLDNRSKSFANSATFPSTLTFSHSWSLPFLLLVIHFVSF